jgi:hypothetical protein
VNLFWENEEMLLTNHGESGIIFINIDIFARAVAKTPMHRARTHKRVQAKYPWFIPSPNDGI